LLDTTVVSVNSALQRARSTLQDTDLTSSDALQPEDDEQRELLARYVDAFERYDIESLTAILHEDATLSMPPYALWLRGHADISGWLLGTGIGCRGSRLVPTEANGSRAFGQYRPSASGDGHDPWALQVIEVSNGQVVGINSFLDTASLFPLFGLPNHLDK
jgi:RNA polymerase sigma-70 factor (ECF subfamily)